MKLGNILLLGVVAAVVAWYSKKQEATAPESSYAAETKPAPVERPSTFRCEGKTRCAQMASCEEAMFYLRNCARTQMDGDGDGIPCESQHCGR